MFAGHELVDELPPLCGDGVHDDTAAIQARLDSGASLVYLPPPEKEYLISRTLRIGSDTELRLDPLTRADSSRTCWWKISTSRAWKASVPPVSRSKKNVLRK